MRRRGICEAAPAVSAHPGAMLAAVAQDTLYELLGVAPDVTAEELRSAYRKLSRKVHPDGGGTAVLFRRVQEAYEVLSDGGRRADYDACLASPDSNFRDFDGAGDDEEDENEEEPVDDEADDFFSAWHDSPPPPPPPPARDAPTADPRHGPLPSFSTAVARYPSTALLVAGILLLLVGVRADVALFWVTGIVMAGLGFTAVRGGRSVAVTEQLRRSGIGALDAMTGKQFETHLARFFSARGAVVRVQRGVESFGSDLLVTSAEGKIVVAVEHGALPVSDRPVQAIVAARGYYRADRALVVTNGTFGTRALALARANQVETWDRQLLASQLALYADPPTMTGWRLLGAELVAGCQARSSRS